MRAPDGTVWGAVDKPDNIVWSMLQDNIVWSMLLDNIVWSMSTVEPTLWNAAPLRQRSGRPERQPKGAAPR
jgi:hypothetical protein